MQWKIVSFRGDQQLFGSRVEEATKVGVRFRMKGAIIAKRVDPARHEHETVELLVELTRTYR